MAKKTSGRRGSTIIALVTVIAALAGPSVATAAPGKSKGPAAQPAGNAYAYAYSYGPDASWVEE